MQGDGWGWKNVWVYVLVCGFVGRRRPARLLVLHGSRIFNLYFLAYLLSSNIFSHS